MERIDERTCADIAAADVQAQCLATERGALLIDPFNDPTDAQAHEPSTAVERLAAAPNVDAR